MQMLHMYTGRDLTKQRETTGDSCKNGRRV